jgi:shikimate kinase
MIITLIGMPGAGKSSVGKRLARLMGYTFIDTDNLIIHAAGALLQKIVDEQGDMALIGVEEQSILALQLKDNSVIATGGSVVYSEKAMQFLKANSVVVYLDVPFEAIAKRLSNIDTRGVVGLKGKGLRELYRERTGLYTAYADVTIKVGARDKVQDVVTRIGEKLQDRGS